MAMYSVNLTKGAARQLDKLPDPTAKLLRKSINELANNPRPYGYKKLKGRDGYRIRVGTYRIIYSIFDKILLIDIIDIGHRRDIYQ
jgi:mRNA interferase RelE/StbE